MSYESSADGAVSEMEDRQSNGRSQNGRNDHLPWSRSLMRDRDLAPRAHRASVRVARAGNCPLPEATTSVRRAMPVRCRSQTPRTLSSSGRQIFAQLTRQHLALVSLHPCERKSRITLVIFLRMGKEIAIAIRMCVGIAVSSSDAFQVASLQMSLSTKGISAIEETLHTDKGIGLVKSSVDRIGWH